MEQLIIAEYDKYKTAILEALRNRFESKLSDEEYNFILETLGTSLKDMIQLMREGKSAHEKFFSDIILNSIDAIIGFDNDSKIFLWNKGAENIFGYTRQEMAGRDFEVLLPEHKLKQGEKDFLINEVIEHGFLANFETERIAKNGSKLNVSITRFAVYNEQHEMIGSVGIVRDITKVKKLEKELREKENLALIGEVVSSIAHSLSNPLNIISGNADYLLLDKRENEKEYEELKTIVEEATRITRSIRHLLNFSRPLTISKQENKMNDVINEIIKNCKYLTDGKTIHFKKQLEKDLGATRFDKAQVQEVLTNIITNGMQAIQKEGEIKVKTSGDERNIYIEISDTGSGIPKENLDRIFMPFFSSKEYGKGTGLGLSIAKKVIKEHEGNISVKSHIGKGTTFSIKLPR
ncbi:MAG: PAS domain S-box protein [Ignavibacteriae bacterium]|nr:MAG: PAS domain S-box protein [Ignavibacteriota bacterium]